MNWRTGALLALGVMWLVASGCATGPIEPVRLQQARAEIPEAQLIDVVIAPLATGVPEDPDERDEDVYTEVREAESRFLSMHLKKTIESSGHWGSVNVAPASDDVGLAIQGEILDSDGESLELQITATDATGRVWFEEEYDSTLPVGTYLVAEQEQVEPFQHLFNQISNDLVEARQELEEEERVEIGRVAELRFASSLAPDAFADHLVTDRKGLTRVARLPARDDTMLERVQAIRDRDRALRETLDASYTDFYDDMREPYHRWRSFTADEVVMLRKTKRVAYTQVGLGVLAAVGGIALSVVSPGLASELLSAPLVVAGLYGASRGAQKVQETSIHVGAIEELGNSFEADMTPRVVEVRGETVRITGNAEVQYDEWRKLLSEIYQAETGLLAVDPPALGVSDVSAGPPPTLPQRQQDDEFEATSGS